MRRATINGSSWLTGLVSPAMLAHHAWVLVYGQQYDDAVVQLERALALAPDLVPARRCLARVQVLDVDWHRREQALAATDLIVCAEEDISEQVFLSLQSPDGSCRLLCDLAESGAGDRALIERFLRGHDLVRHHLALGLCDYRLLRLQKQR